MAKKAGWIREVMNPEMVTSKVPYEGHYIQPDSAEQKMADLRKRKNFENPKDTAQQRKWTVQEDDEQESKWCY